MELLGQRAVPFLWNFPEEIPYCFPQWLHKSAFPPTVHCTLHNFQLTAVSLQVPCHGPLAFCVFPTCHLRSQIFQICCTSCPCVFCFIFHFWSAFHFVLFDLYLFITLSVSCSLSRPGRFTRDSERQKKMCGAVGMPDIPLFKGGVIHAHCKPCVMQQEAPKSFIY